MTLRRRILKGTAALSVGQGISSLCTFIRLIIILPWFLSKADFGIAGFFAVTIALLDMISNLSLERLVIQSKEGDDPSFQTMSQLIQVVRGLLTGILLYFLAWPITPILLSAELSGEVDLAVLNEEQVRSAFQCLAIIPVMRGFFHLDVIRFQREMKYTPSIILEVIPQVAITIIAWPLAAWLGNYWAILWMLIGRWALAVIGSHLLAVRAYRWGWNKAFTARIISFGWPLLVNGALIFLIFQGDKLLISIFDTYDMDDLGVYFWATALAMQPGFMFLKVLGSIMMPVLSRAQHTAEEFSKRYAMILQVLALFATWFAIAFIIAAGPFIEVFRPKFQECAVFIGWLAATQAFRIMRAGPTIAAMAKADTKNLMISNIVRASGFGLVIIVAYYEAPLKWVAIAGFVSEVLALTVSVARTALRQKLPLNLTLGPVLLTTAMLIVSALLANQSSEWGLPTISALSAVLALLSLGGMIVVFHDFRAQLFKTTASALSFLSGASAKHSTDADDGEDDNRKN